MNLRELREKRANIVEQMTALHAKAVAENRALSEDEQRQWDELERQVEQVKAEIARAEKLADEEREMASSTTVVGPAVWNRAPAVLRYGRGEDEVRVMARYVRTGDASGLEVRAYNNTPMGIGSGAAGGYAVPTDLFNQIIARRDEAALFPKLGVRRIPGQGTTVRVPIDNEADVLFTSVSEGTSIGQDAPALSYKDFTLVKYAKYVTLSWELLRDEDANLIEFINDWIARGLAATHNNALISEALANGTAALTLDSATAIGAAEIPEFVGKLAPEYQDGAQWILHPSTVAYIQGLNSANQFLFAPAAQSYAGRPSLWGYPVNQSSYCSQIEQTAKSLIFGNFAYMGMREATELTVLRDPYTAAGSGQIRLWFWFDMVYGVLQSEAILYATHPTGS